MIEAGELLAEIDRRTGLALRDADPASTFAELELDSLTIIEVALQLEIVTGGRIADDALAAASTLADLLAWVIVDDHPAR